MYMRTYVSYQANKVMRLMGPAIIESREIRAETISNGDRHERVGPFLRSRDRIFDTTG